MKSKKTHVLDLLSLEWKPSDGFDSKGQFSIYEKNDPPLLLIFVQPSVSLKELANCKTALQNSAFSRVWLIKESKSSWQSQDFLENSGNSRCYFYRFDRKMRKLQAFDKRKVQKPSGTPYLTHPFSIDLDKPYWVGGELAGLAGDFAHRKNTCKTFAKTIDGAMQKSEKQGNLRSFFSKTTAKTLLHELYHIVLNKLES